MTEETAPQSEPRVLQRVVLPLDHNQDVLPLYVEGKVAPGSNESGPDSAEDSHSSLAQRPTSSSGAADLGGTWSSREPDGSLNRRGGVVRAGARVSFGTYFNAFPASYWRRWTTVGQVRLRVRVRGEASVIVYRSTSKGHSWPETSVHLDDDAAQDVEFPLSLRPFIDGGWYWFDVAAGERDAEIEQADWVAAADRHGHPLEQGAGQGPGQGRLSIGITTFNRPDYCVQQLRELGQAEEVLDILDEVFLVDQGTELVEEHPDFAEASKGLADRLRVIYQGNLGGSGGFSRIMDETVQAGRSDYALLLDDDVITEPEGIIRAVTFADMARKPTIVGGHMFSLYDRSVLHTYGERVARYRWFWGPAPHTRHGHDFAAASLRKTPWLHRRIDVDYNGWWMCLIPTPVIRELGLAMPVFIKWDDAEYGLRAAEAGCPTVSLPGVAVWHMPWHEKDDTVDWQAYYHRRNRILAALLHSPYEHGGRLVPESLESQIRHLLSMQYYPAEMALWAIEDLLAGPERLHPDMLRKLGRLRTRRQEFSDQRQDGDVESFPTVRRHKPPRKGKSPSPPRGRLDLVRMAAMAATRQVLPVKRLARSHPQTNVPHQDAQWWLLSRFDSALVSAADGTGVAWYQRQPEEFRELVTRSVALHAQLLREWPNLRERYRAAVTEFTSPERWRETFEASRAEDS